MAVAVAVVVAVAMSWLCTCVYDCAHSPGTGLTLGDANAGRTSRQHGACAVHVCGGCAPLSMIVLTSWGSLYRNHIMGAGARDLAEALKQNTALTTLG